jgi:hypothetical protein
MQAGAILEGVSASGPISIEAAFHQHGDVHNYYPVSVQSTPSAALTDLQRTNRKVLLKRVRQMWIEGVFEQSLDQAALIDINLQEQPDAVVNPFHLEVQETNRPPRPLPAGTSIVQVYDEADGELFILGGPGAGKTMLLLELTRMLLDRAEVDEQLPIPTVFNLSSWTVKQQSVENWLIDELSTKYTVPLPLAREWVNGSQILPLLDGLDEVAKDSRDICAEKINDFRKKHGMEPMVVCSRSGEYRNPKIPLRLRKAVTILPLTDTQINSYISSAERQLAPLQVALREHSILSELATTPLMLYMLKLIYLKSSDGDFSQLGTLVSEQKQVFTKYIEKMFGPKYIEKMFGRRNTMKYFKEQQVIDWLAWLAKRLQMGDQTSFYLEQLQPNWLEGRWRQSVYMWLGVRLPGIIIGGLVMIFVTCFTDENVGWQLVINALSGGLIGGLISAKQHPPKEKRQMWRFSVLRKAILLGLGIGLGTGLAAWWIEGFPPAIAWQDGIIFGIWGLLLMLLLSGSLPFPLVRQHTPLLFSRIGKWFRDPSLVEALKDGILIGILGMLSWGLSVGLNGRPEGGLGYGLLNAFVWLLDGGLGGALISFLVRRTSTTIEPADKLAWWSRKRLYDGLINRRHFRNTLFIGFISILTIGLAYGLSDWLNQNLSDGLNQGLSYELSQGLGWGIGLGGGLAGSYWLLIGLFQSVKSTRLKYEERTVPNEGIRRSLKNGFLLGSLGGFISGIFVGFVAFIFSFGLKFGLSYGLLRIFSELGAGLNFALIRVEPAYGLIFGLGGGLLIAMLYGCLAWWRHWLVRFLLWRSGVMPWQYVRVLDEATQRLLLRKQGGGYSFIHNLLRDHFASRDAVPPPS